MYVQTECFSLTRCLAAQQKLIPMLISLVCVVPSSFPLVADLLGGNESTETTFHIRHQFIRRRDKQHFIQYTTVRTVSSAYVFSLSGLW